MTDARATAARALDGIPGWSGAELTALKGGLTNTTWLVEKNGRRATLKADAVVRAFPFASRADEAGMQRIAAASGLANDVIFATPTVLLSDYVDGRVWTTEDLQDEQRLQQLGRLLYRVHRLPPSGRRFNALAAARQYAERTATKAAIDPVAVDEHLGILQSLPEPDPICCCHNDVVAENIVGTPELRLIDWEYAGDNDPMFDIAIVVVHHDLDVAQTNCLLDAYADRASARLQARLAREVRRYRSLAWLWQAASP